MNNKTMAIIVPEMLPVPPVQGGAVEHWVDEVSRQLSQTGEHITVVSRPSGLPENPGGGIRYIGIPWTSAERFFFSLKEKSSRKNPLRHLAKIQNVFSYGRRVAAAVRDFDLIYLHNEPNILLLLNKQPGQKLVLHMHNDHLTMRMFRPLYRRALKKVDLVICVSDYIRHSAIRYFPEYADKFKVLFNATDPTVFRPYGNQAFEQLQDIVRFEPDKHYLLYVGRLNAVKGVHILIEAFQEIHRRLPHTRLIITGSSFFGGAAKTPYEESLVALASPVSDAILFTGFLPHEKLKYLYSAVDMVVLPSVWQDPCPLVALEAMASATCLLSSAVGGVPEVVEHGVTGILVQASDPTAMAEAVCKTLESAEDMQTMANAAREKIIQGYAWPRLVKELQALLS